MTAADVDDWRPACGACGSTSMRVVWRAEVEPAVQVYCCASCGLPWDGSEAPEPKRDEDECSII